MTAAADKRQKICANDRKLGAEDKDRRASGGRVIQRTWNQSMMRRRPGTQKRRVHHTEDMARHADGETSRAGGVHAMQKTRRTMRTAKHPAQAASAPCRRRSAPRKRRGRHTEDKESLSDGERTMRKIRRAIQTAKHPAQAAYAPCGKRGAPCGRQSIPRRRHACHAENMVRHAGGAAFRTPRTHNKARRIPEKRTRPSQHLSRQRIPLASAADHLPPHADASLVTCASPHRTLFSSLHALLLTAVR